MYKIDYTGEYMIYPRKLCLTHYGGLNGKEIQKRGDI